MIIKNSTIIQIKQYLLKNQSKNNFPLVVNNLLLQLLNTKISNNDNIMAIRIKYLSPSWEDFQELGITQIS